MAQIQKKNVNKNKIHKKIKTLYIYQNKLTNFKVLKKYLHFQMKINN